MADWKHEMLDLKHKTNSELLRDLDILYQIAKDPTSIKARQQIKVIQQELEIRSESLARRLKRYNGY